MTDTVVAVLLIIWLLAAPIFGILLLLSGRKQKALKAEITQLHEEVATLSAKLSVLENERLPLTIVEQKAAALDRDVIQRQLEADQAIDKLTAEIDEVRAIYKEKREILNQLLKEVAVYDERLSLAELGVYEPHFDFTDSEKYKEAIRNARAKQKAMISANTAVNLPHNWTVNGSEAQGRTMINRQMRLTLRAFNNECEAAIANTRWNNVNAMEARIQKAAEAIDRTNASMGLSISSTYLELRLEELFLTHEYRENQKEEKEERAEMARAEREEKKLLAEALAAEREEQRYQALLDKAHQEAAINSDDARLIAKIAELEVALQEAHAVSERAKAMAEHTKTGYVYIISNVGSFGEEIVKIGLTRRLNPDDRVKELGDASVPFSFDTHAIIYSEEAPALEAALHREFEKSRVNAANLRKEFFRVRLDEVQEAVKRLAPGASFFSDRESQEYQETLAMRNQLLAQSNVIQEIELFPNEI